MESLRLNTKRIEIMIDDDPKRVVKFNPDDVHLRARIYNLAKEAKRKQDDMQAQLTELETIEGEDSLGLPLKVETAMKLTVDIADFFMTEIDVAFGDGTSGIVFADGFDFESVVVFLEYVLSKFEAVGAKKIDDRLSKSVAKKKVMK